MQGKGKAHPVTCHEGMGWGRGIAPSFLYHQQQIWVINAMFQPLYSQ